MSSTSVEIKVPEYEAIGELFKVYEGKPGHIVQVRTIFELVGDIYGKSVLDLACGYGYFGREFYKRGASKVVGVDISEKMIEIARSESRKNNEDIDFFVGNVSKMDVLGSFDVITAAFLFNYSESPQELKSMFEAAFKNLKPGGRVVAYTVEPDFIFGKGNFSHYGVTVLSNEPCEGGHRMSAEFDTPVSSKFTFYRWPRDTYEKAIYDSGFTNCFWQKPLVTDADIARHPEGFWDAYQNNCFHTALVCER